MIEIDPTVRMVTTLRTLFDVIEGSIFFLYAYINSMETIFRYLDYRQFLKDYYSYMKEQYTYFSYRWFAQKAKISSPGLYARLISGERNLTKNTVNGYIRGMELNDKEAEYFRALVGFNQAESSDEKQRHYTIMISMAEFVREHQLAADEYLYLSQWYIPALREIICLYPFHNDFKYLSQLITPPITERQAKAAFDLLLRLEFIKENDDGTYARSDVAITTGDSAEKMIQLACRSYHKKMHSLVEKKLDEVPVKERFAAGTTMSISDNCYHAIIAEYEAFRARVITLIDRDKDVDKVYQMGFHLFPLSNTSNGEK